MQLTDITIRTLKAPERGQRTYFDDHLKGFGVRVSRGGSKTFVLMHGSKRQLTTLGRVGVLKLKEARQKAKTILARQQLAQTNEPEALPFPKAMELFLKLHHEARNKPSTVYEVRRILIRHLSEPFQHKNVADITKADINLILDDLADKPQEALHLFTAARTLFRFCKRRGYIERSPLEGAEPPAKAGSRDRVLSDTELAQTLATARSWSIYGQIIQLLILTLQREGQIAHLRGEWIDGDERLIHFPADAMKGNRPHTIPYGDMAAAIIERLPKHGLLLPHHDGGIFRSWSRHKEKFGQACPLAHWTLHDLRRTGATKWAELGIAPHITERMLDHRNGTLRGVALIYNRHSYLPELREAVKLWEDKLRRLHVSVVAA